MNVPTSFLYEEVLENKGKRNRGKFDSPRNIHRTCFIKTPKYVLVPHSIKISAFFDDNERIEFGRVQLIRELREY